jgi:hypothetical protein
MGDRCKMKLWKRHIGLLVLSALLLIGSVDAKDCGTGIADCECGDTVVADWTFTGDLRCPTGHGLVIGMDNISIDGNGYTLGGVTPGTCDGMGVQRSGIYNKAHDNVVIKNLAIEKFCNGIYLRFDDDAGKIVYRNTIDGCEIHHNGNDSGGDTSTHGIKMLGVSDSIVTSCKVHHNVGKGTSCESGGNGIFLMGTTSGDGGMRNLITHNEIYENTKGGFLTKMKPEYSNVTHNKIWGNGQGGIILRCRKSAHHIIEFNEVMENYGSGIFIGGPDNIVRHNIVKNNKNGSAYTGVVGKYGRGINMGRSDGSFDNKIISNEVCGNAGVDIELCPECTGNTGDENTCDSVINYNDEGTAGCTYACNEETDAENLAKELSTQGWVMYGAERCGFCKKQKEEFGDAFEFINYVDCGSREYPNPACINAGIGPIPDWVSPNGTHYTGYQNLTQLTQLRGDYRAAQPTPTVTPPLSPSPSITASPTPTPPGFTATATVTVAGVLVMYLLLKRRRE